MPRMFSDQDAEHLAREIARIDGASPGQAGWDFLRAEQRDRYRRYARGILRAGYRLPTERASMHQRLNEVVARVENLESGFAALVTEMESQALTADLGDLIEAHSAKSPDFAAGVASAEAALGPRPPKVCVIPECGCSGLAHP